MLDIQTNPKDLKLLTWDITDEMSNATSGFTNAENNP